jgi:hypothetical protein
MNIDKILDKETQLLSVTGLYLSEFEELHHSFKPRWKQAFKHFDTRGTRRKAPLTLNSGACDKEEGIKDNSQINLPLSLPIHKLFRSFPLVISEQLISGLHIL